MKKPAKILILVACAFLTAVFFVPLWHIKLDAPQYPGGLDMFIWINQITGTDEFTLQNINILNHYIGMQAIQADSFKELEIMPYVLIFFIISGLITAFVNKKKVTMVCLAIMIIGGTIGLVDFYLWQQAFGNELDPNAPIKVVGMSYSPPFLGNKTLLNIKASSYPHWGGIFFGIALVLTAASLFFEKNNATVRSKNSVLVGSVVAGLMVLFSSCQPESQAIDYGFDVCRHCRMTVSDDRFGSELVTVRGKVYKFDAIECLVEYKNASTEEYAFQLVTDFNEPGKFIEAQSAWYLKSEAIPSPIGMGLSAFEDEADAGKIATEKGGEVHSWDEAKNLSMGKNEGDHRLMN